MLAHARLLRGGDPVEGGKEIIRHAPAHGGDRRRPTLRHFDPTVGGTSATNQYCGLISAGLYQINLTVPATLSAGSIPVVVTQGGASSQTTALLRVVTN